MVLAVALGTMGFIVVWTMSQDVKLNINKDLELLGGVTQIKVYFETRKDNPNILRPGWFRDDTVEAIRALPDVSGAGLLVLGPEVKTEFRGEPHYLQLVGVDAQFWDVNDFSGTSGRLFNEDDVSGRRRVCVLGKKLAGRFVKSGDMVGQLLPLNQDLFEVTGIMSGFGVDDRSEWVFIPITTAQDRLPGENLPRILYVRVKTWNDVRRMSEVVRQTVIRCQPSEGLQIRVAFERLEHVLKVSWWIELFIYVSIGITFLLGGLGIFNIQTTAVRHRTREIGLKKAMGAKDRDILSEFLSESLSLSLMAAGIGLVLGRVGVELLARMLDTGLPEQLFFQSVILGILFSVLIGVGAGLYPSIRASRMEVVSAIRYE